MQALFRSTRRPSFLFFCSVWSATHAFSKSWRSWRTIATFATFARQPASCINQQQRRRTTTKLRKTFADITTRFFSNSSTSSRSEQNTDRETICMQSLRAAWLVHVPMIQARTFTIDRAIVHTQNKNTLHCPSFIQRAQKAREENHNKNLIQQDSSHRQQKKNMKAFHSLSVLELRSNWIDI